MTNQTPSAASEQEKLSVDDAKGTCKQLRRSVLSPLVIAWPAARRTAFLPGIG